MTSHLFLTLTMCRKLPSTWRHVRYLLKFSKESESEQIFTIVIFYQSKTGVRMLLTSQIKKLGAILKKLI